MTLPEVRHWHASDSLTHSMTGTLPSTWQHMRVYVLRRRQWRSTCHPQVSGKLLQSGRRWAAVAYLQPVPEGRAFECGCRHSGALCTSLVLSASCFDPTAYHFGGSDIKARQNFLPIFLPFKAGGLVQPGLLHTRPVDRAGTPVGNMIQAVLGCRWCCATMFCTAADQTTAGICGGPGCRSSRASQSCGARMAALCPLQYH